MPAERSEPFNDVFLIVLKSLEAAGVLNEFVLIGSWCLPLYRHHFGGSDLIPAARTADVDLLVLRPGKPMREVDIPKVLAGIGFLEDVAFATGYAKYNREGFVVEFLSPLRGSGEEQVQKVGPLKITVQGLRYLNYREDELLILEYKGLAVRVPRPELYTLFKFIVHEQRKKPAKKEKDLETAQQMTRFLMDSAEGRDGLLWAFSRLTKKERQAVVRITEEKAPLLRELIRADAIQVVA
jgi:hypothetical protein